MATARNDAPIQAPPIPRTRFRPGIKVNARLAHVETPNRFWIHLENGTAQQIKAEIKSLLNTSFIGLPEIYGGILSTSSFCLAPDENGDYLRAQVLEWRSHAQCTGCQVVRVRYIDVGQTEWISQCLLVPVMSILRHYPWQAYSCSLPSLSPRNGTSWSIEETNRFRDFLRDRLLLVAFTENLPAGEDYQKITLLERLTETDDETGIAKTMELDMIDKIIPAIGTRESQNNLSDLMDQGPSTSNHNDPPEVLQNWQVEQKGAPMTSTKSGRKKLFSLKPQSPSTSSMGASDGEYSGPVWVGANATDPKLLQGQQINVPSISDVEKFTDPTTGSVKVWMGATDTLTPGMFFVHPMKPNMDPFSQYTELIERLRRLSNDLDEFYGIEENRINIPMSHLVALENGLTMFGICRKGGVASDSDGGEWQRVQILSADISQNMMRNIGAYEQQGRSRRDNLIGDSCQLLIKVRYLDWGGVGVKLYTDVFKIDRRFCSMDSQAWACGLFGVRPVNEGEYWTQESTERFRSIIRVDAPLEAAFMYKRMGRSKQGSEGEFRVVLMSQDKTCLNEKLAEVHGAEIFSEDLDTE